MSSFEEIPDKDTLAKTLIDTEATGGEEDPGFIPTPLDRVLAVNKPQKEDADAREAPPTPTNVFALRGAQPPAPTSEQQEAA